MSPLTVRITSPEGTGSVSADATVIPRVTTSRAGRNRTERRIPYPWTQQEDSGSRSGTAVTGRPHFAHRPRATGEIGRSSGGERGGKDVYIAVVTEQLKKKKNKK